MKSRITTQSASPHLRNVVKKMVISQISEIAHRPITGEEKIEDLGIDYNDLIRNLEAQNPKICIAWELNQRPVEKIADFWSKQAPGIIQKH